MRHVWINVRMISEANVPVRVPDNLSHEDAVEEAKRIINAKAPGDRLPSGSVKTRWELEEFE